MLMVLGSVTGAVLAFAGAFVFLFHSLTGRLIPAQAAGLEDRLQAGILGASLLVVGAVSMVAAYHGMEWLRGARQPKAAAPPRRGWQILE